MYFVGLWAEFGCVFCGALGNIFLVMHCVCRDVDDIHDMMDDINEQNEIADEIGSALSQPIGFAADLDEVSYNPAIREECRAKA